MVRIALIALVFTAAGAFAQEAPTAFAPPVSAKALQDAVHALPQAQAAAYAGRLSEIQTFNVFAGQNGVLRAAAAARSSKRVQVGENYGVDLGPTDVLVDYFVEGGVHHFLGAVASQDAYALRVQMELSFLGDEDALFVIDPNGPRAHGPYTGNDAYDGGWWSPTVEGDTAIVMVQSQTADTPELFVTAMSHHFLDEQTTAKELSCNNLIACESNEDIQRISTGIGRMSVVTAFGTFRCSGSLVNNPATAALEPLYLTANHCVSTESEADTVEVLWDFRAPSCSPSSQPPSIATLPRSNATQLLATDGALDLTLLRLDNVPSGGLGRAYLGWTAEGPTVGADMIGIHHPGAAHMRISYGDVTALDQTPQVWVKQIRVEWFDGVTEGGSSGSPILFDDGDFQVFGVLSNGAVHDCRQIPSENFDNYASFKDFLPQVSTWLMGTSALDDGEAPEGDFPPDGSATEADCPVEVTLKDYPQLVKSLRSLRDSGLLKTEFGRALVKQYYEAAPGLAALVSESELLRGLTLLGAGAAANEE